jgi:Ca2+-binding EF-hand superfamily protein
MDVLLHGTLQEKYKQSFQLLDIQGHGRIQIGDLKKVALNLT